MLSSGEDIEDIIAEKYSNSLRDSDLEWARAHIKRHEDFEDQGSEITKYSFPDKPNFELIPSLGLGQIGFRINKFEKKWIGDEGQHRVSFKLFFEFGSHLNLTPDLFFKYSTALRENQFNGGCKIQLRPEKIRFCMNNIVTHANSENDLLIAEKVGEDTFGGILSSRGRGGDVLISSVENEVLDWNNYLCKFKSVELLPDEPLKFIRSS